MGDYFFKPHSWLEEEIFKQQMQGFVAPMKGVVKVKKTLVERLREERDELEKKIDAIKEFNNSINVDYLNKEDRDLLIAQENAMVTYHEILQIRIRRLKGEN